MYSKIEEFPEGKHFFINDELKETHYKDGTICYYNENGKICSVKYLPIKRISDKQREKWEKMKTWTNVTNFMSHINESITAR